MGQQRHFGDATNYGRNTGVGSSLMVELDLGSFSENVPEVGKLPLFGFEQRLSPALLSLFLNGAFCSNAFANGRERGERRKGAWAPSPSFFILCF